MEGSTVSKFFGDWKLVVESCKYDEGIIPSFATHSFSQGKQPNQIHVAVEWQDDKHHKFEYTLTADGKVHPNQQYNGHKMNMTATIDGQKLKVLIQSDTYHCEYEVQSDTNTITLFMKYSKEGDWKNFHQTYKR